MPTFHKVQKDVSYTLEEYVRRRLISYSLWEKANYTRNGRGIDRLEQLLNLMNNSAFRTRIATYPVGVLNALFSNVNNNELSAAEIVEAALNITLAFGSTWR